MRCAVATAFLAVGAHAAAVTPLAARATSSSSSGGWETRYTATGTAAVAAAAATAKTSSPTSNVKGKAFDRFVIIWNENTDYDKAIGDSKCFFEPFAPSESDLSQPTLHGSPRRASRCPTTLLSLILLSPITLHRSLEIIWE